MSSSSILQEFDPLPLPQKPTCRSGRSLFVFALLFVAPLHTASAGVLEEYVVRDDLQFSLPALDPTGFQPPSATAVLPDGRILAVVTDDSDAAPQNFSAGTPKLFVESGVGTRSFALVGDLPLPAVPPATAWPDFGASFLSISPSGNRVAVGNNNGRVGVFSAAGLAGGGPVPAVSWFEVDHFDAAWFDEDLLAVTNLAGVQTFDTASTSTDTIITGTTASGGITLDGGGNLYMADGFGANAGNVRRFTLADWQNALATGAPLDFFSGEDLLTFSSAASLALDNEGNLLVGGGLFTQPFEESNAFAAFRPADGTLRTFDPNAVENEEGNFYVLTFNPVTDEIYINEPFALNNSRRIDNTRMFVVAAGGSAGAPVVPEPGGLPLLAVAMLIFGRRHTGKRRCRQ